MTNLSRMGLGRMFNENSVSPSFCLVILGQKRGFQPLPDFMIMMRSIKDLKARSFITLRNQRGYGTQKNWMAVRQELLYYTKGNPCFDVQYTDIPKILRGYYKKIGGKVTENTKRGKSSASIEIELQPMNFNHIHVPMIPNTKKNQKIPKPLHRAVRLIFKSRSSMSGPYKITSSKLCSSAINLDFFCCFK